MNNKIDKIEAKEILDSRGNPTISVTVFSGDTSGSFSVPSGASTGSHEACELRDPDGHVSRAIDNVHSIIAPALAGMDITDQQAVDETMIKLDGTPNKSNLGANAMLGVSVAVAKTAAMVAGVPLYVHLQRLSKTEGAQKAPYLFMNLINGGRHAKNGLAFQEYHIVIDTRDASEAIELGEKVQGELVNIIQKKKGSLPPKGDEGGLAPIVSDIREPLVYLREAVSNLGIEHKTKFALDVAA
ncbi:MAG TPA: phosphopyruvate hydratase, partial [Candidatus Paceibacterota bacterium]